MELSFKKIEKKDEERVKKWLKASHVTPYFFGEGLKNTVEALEIACKGEKADFDQWIGYCEGVPFAYLMTTFVQKENDPLFKNHLKGKAITLDLLIGEEAFLGKGLAAPMILAFIEQVFPDVDQVFIDPEIENTKAIHVYKKAGFTPVKEFIPNWNPKPHLLLLLEPPKG